MPAESSSRSDRPSLAHSQRSAPDTPSRSTIFHPEPPQSGQTSSAMDFYYPLPGDLLNGRQNRARGDRLALAHRHRGHMSRAARFHFVLHLHGLDYYDALSGRDRFTGLHQYTHDLARHGCDDGLAIMAERGGAGLHPSPGVGDRDAEPPAAHRNPCARVAILVTILVTMLGTLLVTTLGARFVAAAIQQHGKYPRLHFCELGLAFVLIADAVAVQVAIAMHFEPRGHAVDLEVEGHCSSSSRPARRHAAPAFRWFLVDGPRVVRKACATKAATASSSASFPGFGLRLRKSSTSPVCSTARRISSSSSNCRKNARLVLIPATWYSSSARIMRTLASSRDPAHTASFASSGS